MEVKTNFNIRPVQDVCWVKPEPKPNTTESGIIHLPEEVRELREYPVHGTNSKVKTLDPETRFSHMGDCLIGIVVAVGPGKHVDGIFKPMQLKVGDKVMIPPNNGVEQMYGGEYYLVLREPNIYAKLN